MTVFQAPRLPRLGKLALAVTLVLGASPWIVPPGPAQAQQILLVCTPPLVANSDGTDCVRPAPKAKTSCPAFLQPFQGRCIEPNHYIKFRDCSGNPRNFEIAIYPTSVGEDLYVLFINGKRQSAHSDKVFKLFGARAAGGGDRPCRLN